MAAPTTDIAQRLDRLLADVAPSVRVLVCECGAQLVEPAEKCGFCVAEEAEREAAVA